MLDLRKAVWSAMLATAMAGNASAVSAQPEPMPADKTVTAVSASAGRTIDHAGQRNDEIQIEYMDARFFKERNINQYNVHWYHQYRTLGRLSLHYGATFTRATGFTFDDGIVRDSAAVGLGPSYMMRYTWHIGHRTDLTLDGTGSVMAYDKAHPAQGRGYGFQWRIGPRLIWHVGPHGSQNLGYMFHHSSNGMKSHNPGYNGVGFSLGYQHWY